MIEMRSGEKKEQLLGRKFAKLVAKRKPEPF